MNIRTLHDRLSSNLGMLVHKVDIENAANNQSLNVLLETPFLKILNALYDLELVNSNLLTSNFSAIDGIDSKKRVMVQITSTPTTEKIRNTVGKIIDNDYHNDYDTLYFMFLKNKKSISRSAQEEILKMIGGRFSFSFSENVIDPGDINRLLVNHPDAMKAFEVNRILDSILFDIENNSDTNMDYIGLSFDEDEIEIAYQLSEIMIRQGLNVVVDTQKIQTLFQERKSKYINGLVVLKEGSSLEFLKHVAVISSASHIKNTIDSKEPKCRIFRYGLAKGIKLLNLSFNDLIESVKNKHCKNPRSVKITSPAKIESLLRNHLQPKTSLKYSLEEIKHVLKSLFPIHKCLPIAEEKNFCVYSFPYRNSVINFLIFSHDYTRNEVLRQFDSLYKKKYYENLIILLPRDYEQTTNQRKESVAEKYANAQVDYLDEYLFENSLGKIPQDSLLLNDIFIPPFFNVEGEIEKLDDVFNWLRNDDSPVAFITGSGGDGKTTVCQKIHDEIIAEFDNHLVIFLDAQSYIEEIKTRERIENWKFDLQTVFEISNKQSCNLDINTFKSNFTFGNITVIIDGIDEIISTLPNFSLADFLNDFKQLEETIGRGKLIINCREIYINELLHGDDSFQSTHKFFHLLKFNKDLSVKYFKKHFCNDTRKVEDSIRLLADFYEDINGEEFSYSPFVLEIIATIVENDFNYEEIDYYFDSKILLKKSSNDYLIYKICKREIAKKEIHGFVISVDDYVRLLGLISIEKNGIFNDNDFSILLKKLNIDLNSEKVKNSLRDNPFFYYENRNYRFRFDFYTSFFKYNVLYSKIADSSSFDLTDALITLIAQDLKYNSVQFQGLRYKLEESGLSFRDIVAKVKGLVSDIQHYGEKHPANGSAYIRQLAISNLVVFLDDIKDRDLSSTDIILELFADKSFSGKGTIAMQGMYLIEIPEGIKLRFDFSYMYFVETVIDGYCDFLNCTFNEDTYFDHTCRISKIQNEKLDIRLCSAKSTNFDNHISSNDNALFKALMLAKSGGENILTYLRKYFKAFLLGNKLLEKINASSLPKKDLYSISLAELNAILLENGILKEVLKDEIVLNPQIKSKILKFINQNLTFSELNRAIKKIHAKEISG